MRRDDGMMGRAEQGSREAQNGSPSRLHMPRGATSGSRHAKVESRWAVDSCSVWEQRCKCKCKCKLTDSWRRRGRDSVRPAPRTRCPVDSEAPTSCDAARAKPSPRERRADMANQTAIRLQQRQGRRGQTWTGGVGPKSVAGQLPVPSACLCLCLSVPVCARLRPSAKCEPKHDGTRRREACERGRGGGVGTRGRTERGMRAATATGERGRPKACCVARNVLEHEQLQA